MADVKKRGGGDVDEEITIPKKRGRPAKANKVKKPPSGRGRGRPPKNVKVSPKKNLAADDSDEDGNDVATNGGTARSPGKKEKLTEIGNAKGRGRTKNPPISEEDEEDEIDDDDDDEQLSDYKSGGGGSKKVGRKSKTTKKTGRPKKITKSDEEDDEESDDEKSVEEKSVGRGQSRPKKAMAVVTKRPAETAANGGSGAGVPKKRGRTSIAAPAALPAKNPGSSKGRGRPKTTVVADSLSEDDEDDKEDASNDENEKTKPQEEDDKDDSIDGDNGDQPYELATA